MESPHKKKEVKVLCPKCWEYGSFGYGWTANPRDNIFQVQYVRHYSSEVYRKQMVRYRNHEIKSRPNGQKRCYLGGCAVYPLPNTDYDIAYCKYNPHLEKGYRLHKLRWISELTTIFRARRRLGLVGVPRTPLPARPSAPTPTPVIVNPS